MMFCSFWDFIESFVSNYERAMNLTTKAGYKQFTRPSWAPDKATYAQAKVEVRFDCSG